MKKRIIQLIFLILLLSVFAEGKEVSHVVISDAKNVIFMKNIGTGKFEPAHITTAGLKQPRDPTVADFDNDNILDIAVADWVDGKFAILWGKKENGKLSFQDQTYNADLARESGCLEGEGECPANIHAIGKGDFDNNGFLDLVLVDNRENTKRSVIVALNDGKRNWKKMQRYELQENKNARVITVGDFNQDKRIDFLVPEIKGGIAAQGKILSWFWGDGQGNFNIEEKAWGTQMLDVESKDIDKDGDLDLVLADGNVISFLINNGNKKFSTGETLCALENNECQTDHFTAVELSDFNNDGLIDVVGKQRDNEFYIWKGEASGKFIFVEKRGANELSLITDMTTADVNNDEISDLIIGTATGNEGTVGEVHVALSVFLGKGDGSFFTANSFLVERMNYQLPTFLDIYPEEIETAGDQKFIRGDVDQSGNIEITDAVNILRYLFQGGELACLDAADVDDTGVINMSDAIRILNFLFLGGKPPATPYPKPDVDPTEDTLEC